MKSFFYFLALGCFTAILFAFVGAALGGDGGAIVGFLAASGFAAYFTPSYIGYARRHPNKHAMCALNIFLGWTLIGWVFALVWSLKNFKYQPPVRLIED